VADLNVRLLARAAKAFNMPVVLSTVGVKYGINGPTHASILSDLPGVEPIDRTSMNAFEDGDDAVGGRSQAAHRTAIERMAHAGAVPSTALAVVTELFRDWASPLAGKAREVIYPPRSPG
jgi:hypothetical protein